MMSLILIGLTAMGAALPSPEMLCYDACRAGGKSETQCLNECGHVDKTVTCENVRRDPFDLKVTMAINGPAYEIYKSGQSRNNYGASYYVQHASGTRFGSTVTLKKTADYSTWKDMPDQLVLDHYAIDGLGHDLLMGLSTEPIVFEAEDCK